MHPAPSFQVIPSQGGPSPLIIEVPHAGIDFDAASLSRSAMSGRSVAKDADLYVDRLFSRAPELGATLLFTRMSRYVVDLNREESDVELGMGTSAAPHGVIWRRTTDGRPALLGPLDDQEVARRLDRFYRPYHAALTTCVQEARSRFENVLLICAHSMPSVGRLGDLRADLVPGSRGRTSTAGVYLDQVDRLAEQHQLRVEHDVPYRGGYTTERFGRPAGGVHAIQIELSRKLYMDEHTLSPLPVGFSRTQAFCDRLVSSLRELLAP